MKVVQTPPDSSLDPTAPSKGSSSDPNDGPEDATVGDIQLYIQGPICVCQGAWCCDQDFSVSVKKDHILV